MASSSRMRHNNGHKLLVKGSNIVVTVEDCVPGIIVVSFMHEGRYFRGILLQFHDRSDI